MIPNKYKSKFIIFAIILIIILYLSFLYLDFFNLNFFISSSIIKYTSIIFCFLLAFRLSNNPIKRRDYHLLQLGLFFTLFADLCLLLLNVFPLGITIFCFVQITYSIRYNPDHFKGVIKFFLIAAFIIIMAYIILDASGTPLDLVFPISMFYAICLFTSVITALRGFFKKNYPSPNKYFVSIGMLLFLLCDINVGIFNITNLIYPSSLTITQLSLISGFLMWFFYLPSQLLLSLSGYNYKTDNQK